MVDGCMNSVNDRDQSRHCVYLLLALLAAMVVFPQLPERAGEVGIGMTIAHTLLIITGSFSVSKHRVVTVTMIAALGLTYFLMGLALTLAGRFGADASTQKNLLVVSFIFAIPFYLWVLYVLFRYVMEGYILTGDRITAAVCIYLLFGIIMGMSYAMLWQLDPGEFQFSNSLTDRSFDHMNSFMYYSFATMTTLGSKSVEPVSNYAQSMTILEAAGGVVYLLVVIPRLALMYRLKAE